MKTLVQINLRGQMQGVLLILNPEVSLWRERGRGVGGEGEGRGEGCGDNRLLHHNRYVRQSGYGSPSFGS